MSATLDSKTIFWLNWLGLIWMITFFSGSLAMYSKHVYIYIYIFFCLNQAKRAPGKNPLQRFWIPFVPTFGRSFQSFVKAMDLGRKKTKRSSCCALDSSGWWFQIFFIFTPTWGRFPIWLIFFKWVETTNRMILADFWGISGISHFFLFAQYIYIYIFKWHIIDNSSKFHRHVFKSVFSRLVRYWVVMFVKFRSCFQQPQFLLGIATMYLESLRTRLPHES